MPIKPPTNVTAPKPAAKPGTPAPKPAPAAVSTAKAAPTASPKPAAVAAKPAPAPAAKPAPAAPKPGAGGTSKPAPAAPAAKTAPVAKPALSSEDRISALETKVAEQGETLSALADTLIMKDQRFSVYLAGYTGDEASWEFTADPDKGPSFKPEEATLDDLRLYCWQYSDGDYTQDEKGLRKLAKSIKAKGDLTLSDRAKENALPPADGAPEEVQETEEQEAEEEAVCALGVDDVDTATIDQVKEAASLFGIDLKLYGKGKESALRAIVKKNIAEAQAAQEAESGEETEEETVEEAQVEEFAVGDTVLIYPPDGDGSPDMSQEALQGSVTAIGEPDAEGDRSHTVRFTADMLDACKEAFGDSARAVKNKKGDVVGVSVALPSAGWLTRPAE